MAHSGIFEMELSIGIARLLALCYDVLDTKRDLGCTIDSLPC